jgi:WD40 repeat protein
MSIAADGCGIVGGLNPDSRITAVGCLKHPTQVWDTARDELLAELPAVTPPGDDFPAAYPAVSAAGDRAAIARGNAVEVYELPGGRLVRTITHTAAVSAAAFAAVGHDVISGAVDGSLLMTRDGRDPTALPAATGGIDAAMVLSDGRVVVADARNHLRILDRDGTVLAELPMPSRVRSLRLSPDGARLITIPSYVGETVPPSLWGLDRPRLIAQLEGHTGRGFSVRFVEDGGIVGASNDGTVRLWNGATGQLRQTFHGAHFSADVAVDPSRQLVVAADGGSLRFWDLANGRALWTLQAHTSVIVGIHFEGNDIVTRGFAGEVSRWTLPPAQGVIEAHVTGTLADRGP